ncbi:TIGR03088 family PEP-CTERM/XrtA system glycosyltransferase [Pseudorhodoferax sp.]|uniref:TIGR03088 family PEP-CTERM/XrtA system glycosyltransferase n=1 Tax=Pseudorhodoferax sp. TaxID=1993553 RepID=UPI002DD6612C|nr:TIGR03088 family PEP-CTERM/XrtA system glycosyltransferase [Pseudorhodoferax sp.]
MRHPAAERPVASPLIAHVVYRFDTGGLENGVVNLIDRLTGWRHVVIALTEAVPAFCSRVQRGDVEFVSLHQPPGQGWHSYPAFLHELRRLRPQVVHTRNLAALEMQVPAWWAGMPVRIHGEHGRDQTDPDGTRRKYQWMRRAYRPFVQHYVALSRDLGQYLTGPVGVPAARVSQIYNGVDVDRFAAAGVRQPVPGCPFEGEGLCLAGTVGRMQTVKAQPLLAQAFVQALRQQPALRRSLRLVLVGEGPLRAECEAVLQAGGVRELAWLPGERSDVPAVMRGLDFFVLPSLAEGISNTILEAMASGLPVVATDVGGNADLVADGLTGQIVPAGDVPALAQALQRWATDPARRQAAGLAGRARVEQRFSLQAMVAAYGGLYRSLSARAGRPVPLG